MSVIIDELPIEIQKKIPYSIRTYKNEYELEDLPVSIRTIIEKYIELKSSVSYGVVFDCTPGISEYGDFHAIKNLKTLVLEYLKNYFLTFPEDYPFDPGFGSKLKTYLHMKDTSLQQTFISTEVRNIINAVTADLGVVITIEDMKITPINNSASSDYKIDIKVKINDAIATLTVG